jgi:phage-related protein
MPSSHLGAWLDEHRNLPAPEQERVLRGDPSFMRLPPIEQQRLVEQLHKVNEMSEDQRQRRLARNDMLERLSPQERMQVDNSRRRWATLPPERQALMKNAFHDLRAVPLDQRRTVLNSSRYQGAFTPEERGILADFLRVEPYQPGP